MKRFFAGVLFCLIFLTVLFIFSQSLMPPAASSRESSAVYDFLADFFSVFSLGRFLLSHLRKCAHFAEYAVLAFEVFTLSWVSFGRPMKFLFLRKKRRLLHRCGSFGFYVAFADETLQIFSGRGPSITDVWLDFSGYLFGALALILLSFILSVPSDIKKESAKR